MCPRRGCFILGIRERALSERHIIRLAAPFLGQLLCEPETFLRDRTRALSELSFGDSLRQIGFRLAQSHFQLRATDIALREELLKLCIDPRRGRSPPPARPDRKRDGCTGSEVIRFEV